MSHGGGGRGRLGARSALALACTLLLLAAAGAIAAQARNFDNPASHDTRQQPSYGSVQRQDTPNDPNYDNAEPDTLNQKTSSNLYDERFDLFGFPSLLTPGAIYKAGPLVGKPMIAGFNAAGAWKAERGRPDVTIAVLDTGIKWDNPGLRDKVHLNVRELPPPQPTNASAPHGGYDLNHNNAVDVDDYANDPRVKSRMPAGQQKPTAQDLIHAFSDRTDADRNGYVDDIAGWDFFDDDNDPFDASSYFAAHNHGSGRMEEAVEQGNEGNGSIGVCPRCQLMPIRTWDTFVSDGNTFALGIVYATDNGARMIEGSNGSLYHSRFAEAASNYAYQRGVVQVFSGDDLNTGNHNYPANYGHAMLIQGTVPDTLGLGQNLPNGAGGLPIPVGTQLPVGTFFRGANTTQYGGKSSISMEGSTGSENTGKSSGAAGIVVSAALRRGIVPRPDETRETLEQTAEDILPANTVGTGVPDFSQPGWDPHFGYGRVNLGAAVAVAQSGKLPPEATIDSPDWYAPLTASSARITGLARARFAHGGHFHWRLEWGPGLAPTQWHKVREADATGTVRDFGTLNLNNVRAALAAASVPADTGGPTFSPNSPNPYKQQFAVRVVVTGSGVPTPGMDRRVLTTFHDATLRPGYPKRIGAGGESPIRYADLNGDNVQELIVPGMDGMIRALKPGGGSLAGWPVHTRVLRQAASHASARGLSGLPPALEPPRGPTVGDLDGDGKPEVIVSAGLHVYAWHGDGKPVSGFPVSIDRGFCRPQDESQPLGHRKCGILASPALAHLDGRNERPSIVVSALDGHLYAWHYNGTAAPGFPVDLVDPAIAPGSRMRAESIADPAVGDLNGDGRDDVLASTNETYGAAPEPSDVAGGFQQALSDILASAAGGSSRLYAVNGAGGHFLPGWPIKLNGAIQDTLPLIGPGHDAAIVKLGGQPVVAASTTGGSLSLYSAGGSLIRTMQQSQFGPGSDATDRTVVVNMFEYASIGDVQRDGGRDLVKYGLTLGGLANLALSGQNFPYNHLIGAYDASNGSPLTAFPRITDDYQFLSASNIARIDQRSAANQVVAGTGLGLLHAYDGRSGRDAPGFPKVTGGWLFAPATLATDGRLADITREGFLFVWGTGAAQCQNQWPSFRHDPQGSANYDNDGTAPAAPENARLQRSGNSFKLTFGSPGDDGFCGRATSYRVRSGGKTLTPVTNAPRMTAAAAPKTVAAHKTATLTVTPPKNARKLTVQATDEAGNLGPPVTLKLPGAGDSGGGGSTHFTG